jgi:hypothetical protein
MFSTVARRATGWLRQPVPSKASSTAEIVGDAVDAYDKPLYIEVDQ